jgi:hypothetical protein
MHQWHSMELSPHRRTAANAHSESTQATGQSQQIRSARARAQFFHAETAGIFVMFVTGVVSDD